MGGIGGAMVALSDRTDLTLPGALAVNFAIAIGLGCCGVLCARRISARAAPASS
jgi:chromate transport protein ChrA